MSDWEKLALIHGLVGMEMYSLGFMLSHHGGKDEEATEAMFIIGYLLFVPAALLMVALVFGELKGNQIVQIITVCLFYLAALFILVGWALWADNVNNIGNSYIFTLDVCSTVMAALAGTFLLLMMLGVGGGGSSGGTSKSKTNPSA